MSHHLTALALAALLGATACGGTPPPAADASTDAAEDWPHGCQGSEFRIADACVPARRDMCGAARMQCPAGYICALTGDGDGGDAVRCVESW